MREECGLGSMSRGTNACLFYLTIFKAHVLKACISVSTKSNSDFPCISAQPLLEPLLNNHTMEYLRCIAFGIWDNFNFPMLNPHRQLCKYGPHTFLIFSYSWDVTCQFIKCFPPFEKWPKNDMKSMMALKMKFVAPMPGQIVIAKMQFLDTFNVLL